MTHQRKIEVYKYDTVYTGEPWYTVNMNGTCLAWERNMRFTRKIKIMNKKGVKKCDTRSQQRKKKLNL